MAKELTSAVPLDDDEPISDAVEQEETKLADAESGEAEEAEEGSEPAAATETGLEGLTAEELAALDDDDEPRAGIPKPRFDEVNNERKALAEQNAQLMQALLTERNKSTRVEPQAQARDYDAERSALEIKLQNSEIDMPRYLAEIRKIDRAQDRAEMQAELQPVVKTLEQERQQIQLEKLGQRLQVEAEKVYAKYEFLNPASDSSNADAIAAVIVERDELIKAGIDPVKALKLAVASVAPEYAPSPATPAKQSAEDDLAAARRQKAAAKAAAASVAQPAPLRGTSARTVDPASTITGSVKDADRLERMSSEERERVFQ